MFMQMKKPRQSRYNIWLGLLGILILLPTQSFAVPIIGWFQVVEGDVTVTRDGQTLDVKKGDKVQSGDMVSTTEGSKTQVNTADGNKIVACCTNTMFDITVSGDKSLLRLLKGQVRNRVGRLKVENDWRSVNRYGYGGVRGTDFILSWEEAISAISVFDGSANFDNIIWDDLPDSLFTDILNKSLETLDPIAVLESGYDLGAGNKVIVNSGYYSTLTDGAAPSEPVLGIYPGHSECDDCTIPEPTILTMISLGMIGFGYRRYKAIENISVS